MYQGSNIHKEEHSPNLAGTAREGKESTNSYAEQTIEKLVGIAGGKLEV